MWACDACMRRTWLLGRISGYLQFQRKRLEDILGLDDDVLVRLWCEKVGDGLELEYAQFGACRAEAARASAEAAGLELVCRCDPSYPQSLRRLMQPPAVLHVAGGMDRFLELAGTDSVAIVGSRRATEQGVEVAQLLGRGSSASGLCVVSGMAVGIDAAAHRGALACGGRTLAVLAGSPATPAPRANTQLYREIRLAGAIVSEFGPKVATRDWGFVARNRIVAGLSQLTVVVQARKKSGTASTVRLARKSGIPVGAVPGSVVSRESAGPNQLLAEGAIVIRHPQDVLDAMFGAGLRHAASADRTTLRPEQLALVDAIAAGADTAAGLARAGIGGPLMLVKLAELELAGHIRRGPGGRYLIVG
jgi:DNA processing protein